MDVLVVAEKDQAARRVAEHLAGGDPDRRQVRGVNAYDLRRDGEEWTVVGLRGHVLELDYPPSLNDWGAIEPKDLVWAEPKRQVADHGSRHVAALRDLARDAGGVVVATDHDREGELIGKEAVEVVTEAADGAPVERVRFSSLTEGAVQRAFEDRGVLDEDLAAAAEARQVVDLAWGAALTRFLTMTARGDDDLLSVGRVQSPTLALLVDREREIEDFDPTPYWEIYAELEARGSAFEAQHTGGDDDDRFWDEEEARNRARRATAADEGEVTDVDERTYRDNPPRPFDTTAFVAEATSLGLSAKQALGVAEDLYTRGLVSYPRTDNTVYPSDLDLREILSRLEDGPFGDDAARLASGSLDPTSGDTETTDHPPIHPTSAASRSDLSDRQWKVYALVVRRFLATLSDPAYVETVGVSLDLAGEPFEARGKRVASPGYRRVYPYVETDEVHLPDLQEGDRAGVLGIDLRDKETRPPRRYGQGTLVEKMEELGVGTKSTRPNIVDKLYDRGYVTGGPPRPTPKGRALISALEAHAERVADPDMTADLEEEMAAIAEGEADLDWVVRRSRSALADVLEDLEEAEEELRDQLRPDTGPSGDGDEELGPCDECGGTIVVRRSRKGGRFAGCDAYPDCENSFDLPQRGTVEARGRTCGDCGTPVIAVDDGDGDPWVLCLPYECDGPS
jgi:DNA topoisomerase-1